MRERERDILNDVHFWLLNLMMFEDDRLEIKGNND